MTLLHLEAICATALWAAFGVGYWLARRTWRRESRRWRQVAEKFATHANTFRVAEEIFANALREKGILEAIQDVEIPA